jgi:hypothetical protein
VRFLTSAPWPVVGATWPRARSSALPRVGLHAAPYRRRAAAPAREVSAPERACLPALTRAASTPAQRPRPQKIWIAFLGGQRRGAARSALTCARLAMRSRVSISELLGRRWAPFAGLALGSLAFVAFTIALIPDRLGAPAIGSGNGAATAATEAALPTAAALSTAVTLPTAAAPALDAREEMDSSEPTIPSARHLRRRSKPSTNPPKDPVLLPPFVPDAPSESSPPSAQ